MTTEWTKLNYEQGNRRSHFARAVHPAATEWSRLLLNNVICSNRVTMHFQWGGKPTKLPLPPWDFVTLPEEDQATAIGNMHRKIGKDRACGSGDILPDRQTDRQTHTDILITILRRRSRRQSKNTKNAAAWRTTLHSQLGFATGETLRVLSSTNLTLKQRIVVHCYFRDHQIVLA